MPQVRQLLASAGSEGSVFLWEGGTQKTVVHKTRDDGKGFGCFAAVFPEGKTVNLRMVAGAGDGKLCYWTVRP